MCFRSCQPRKEQLKCDSQIRIRGVSLKDIEFIPHNNNPHSNGFKAGTCYHCDTYHDEWEVESLDDCVAGNIRRKCLKCNHVTKPRYRASKNAYCKYCYNTHNAWKLGDDFGSDIVWVCLICQHATHDVHMQLKGHEKAFII